MSSGLLGSVASPVPEFEGFFGFAYDRPRGVILPGQRMGWGRSRLPDDQCVFRPQVRMIFFELTLSAKISSGVSASLIETASTATFPCANAECNDCPAAIAA